MKKNINQHPKIHSSYWGFVPCRIMYAMLPFCWNEALSNCYSVLLLYWDLFPYWIVGYNLDRWTQTWDRLTGGMLMVQTPVPLIFIQKLEIGYQITNYTCGMSCSGIFWNLAVY